MDNRPLCYKVSDLQSSDRNVVFIYERCHDDGSIRKGYFATKEEAETAWRTKKAAVAAEYKELKPAALQLLYEKAAYLQDVFATLGVAVYTEAEASDDTGLDSWIELAVSIQGENALYSYTLRMDL